MKGTIVVFQHESDFTKMDGGDPPYCCTTFMMVMVMLAMVMMMVMLVMMVMMTMMVILVMVLIVMLVMMILIMMMLMLVIMVVLTMTTKTTGRNTTKIHLEVSKSKPNEKMVSRQQCIGGVTGRRGPGSYISLFSSYISFLHFNAFSPPTFHFYI